MARNGHLVVHGDQAVARHFPERHPLKPGRPDAAIAHLVRAGIVGDGAIPVVAPSRASDADLRRVHAPAYLDVAQRLSLPGRDPRNLLVDPREATAFGFSPDGDNPPYLDMVEVGRHACGGVIDAARHVLGGGGIAFVPAAGANHHAKRARASGFGILNDAAVAIASLRAEGVRVAYVDLDVHHGDGVEEAFAADPSVLTISIHESTRYLFPGPPGGLHDCIGSGPGTGFAVNVPLAPWSDDTEWLGAFETIIPPLLEAFRPDVTVVQCGTDGYHADPLAHLLVGERAYVTAAARLRDLTGGRLVAIGGGGYDVAATARIWAAMFATFVGAKVPDEWTTGEPAQVPDGRTMARVAAENGINVAAVRRLVFPHHGLGLT